jgi:hypothetical protein
VNGKTMLLVPLEILGKTTIEGQLVGPTRCGLPTLVAGYGHQEGRSCCIVAAEWPDYYRPHRDKSSKEQQHMNRFLSDWRTGLGNAPYESLLAGDKPDFAGVDERGPIGIDLSQLVVQDRVEAAARFARLRSELYQVGPKRLRHLRGRILYVNLGHDADGALELNEALPALLNAIEQHQPYDGNYQQGMPSALDARHIQTFESGRLTSAALSGLPSSPFFGTMNFEIALAYSTTIYDEDAFAALQRLVVDHDQHGYDDLIVSAEAPTVEGYAYPSDYVLVRGALQEARTHALSAKHLSRVYLHDWSTRGIYRLDPGENGVSHLCGDHAIV